MVIWAVFQQLLFAFRCKSLVFEGPLFSVFLFANSPFLDFLRFVAVELLVVSGEFGGSIFRFFGFEVRCR